MSRDEGGEAGRISDTGRGCPALWPLESQVWPADHEARQLSTGCRPTGPGFEKATGGLKVKTGLTEGNGKETMASFFFPFFWGGTAMVSGLDE